MWSTIVSLSLSTVFGLLGLVGIIGAAISSNWVEYSVNRRNIVNVFNQEPELNIRLKDDFIRNPLYFSRSNGLFVTCFNDAVPSEIGSFPYLTLPCIYIKDYLPIQAKQDSMSPNEITRLWVLRATALLYAIGLAVAVFALTLGIIACWKVSSRLIVCVGCMLLFAVLCLGGAMAGWHYNQYLEKDVLTEAPFQNGWESVLKKTTSIHYGYSYVASWIGILFLLLSAAFMLIASCYANRSDDKEYEAKHDAYMMNHFYDKGGAAVVPYYNSYSAGAYGAYPPGPYATYGGYPSAYGTPYGYMTYGRQ